MIQSNPIFSFKNIARLWLIGGLLLLLPLKSWAVLNAEGWGTTPKAAQENALQELSQIVSAAVDSNVSIRNELRENQVSQEVSSSLKVKSSSYFQGVKYTPAAPDSQGFRTEAYLDRQAAMQTVSQLQNAIGIDLATLSRNQINDVIDRAVFLAAFLNLMPNDFAGKAETLRQAGEIRQQAYQYLNFAQLTFHLKPPTARVSVGQYVFEAGKTQLIPPGNYRLEASAEGYQTRNEPLFLSAGEKRQVNLDLVPAIQGRIQLIVNGEHQSAIFNEARQVLSGLGVSHDAQSPNHLTLTLQKQFVTEISGIQFYNLRLVAEVSKQQQPLLTRTASLNNQAESQVEARLQAMSKVLINAVLSAKETQVLWQQ